jgi:hypothetical protein
MEDLSLLILCPDALQYVSNIRLNFVAGALFHEHNTIIGKE